VTEGPGEGGPATGEGGPATGEGERATGEAGDRGAVLSHAGGGALLDLVRVMQRLRGPDGCPWDREQTHRSLGRHLLEEAHETLEAIDSGDPALLREELGDVLLQVVFHAEMARQEGTFDVDDVAEGIAAKLVRRHPHVFGEVRVASAAEVLVNWERIKAEEKGEHGVDEEIPASLPALARAAKVQRRAAGYGFDWRSVEGALGKVHEELAELEAELGRVPEDGGGAARTEAPPPRVEEEVGDVLFAVAALARRANVDPETALRRATRRFADRFERMRATAEAQGLDLAELSDRDLVDRFRAAAAGG
jgi:tetrapyrrole methylase family protein / MazG family protein